MLHAAYTPEAVTQVRREMGLEDGSGATDPDAESVWWLAACSVCEEGHVSEEQLIDQMVAFEQLAADRDARLAAAEQALAAMLDGFEVTDGVAYATRDGGMQGAYLAGHRFAVHYADAYGIYFIGTIEESLGLEDFAWAEPGDPNGATREQVLGRSGPVFGSRQFVKACDAAELERALEVVVATLR